MTLCAADFCLQAWKLTSTFSHDTLERPANSFSAESQYNKKKNAVNFFNSLKFIEHFIHKLKQQSQLQKIHYIFCIMSSNGT